MEEKMTYTNVLELGRRSAPRVSSKAPRVGLPQAAAALAYAGALPLIVGAMMIALSPERAGAAASLMALYGAALIVFFGGVRWGVAVMREEGPGFASLLGAVLPMLAGLPLFLDFDVRAKFALIMLALGALLIDDLRATRAGSGAPAWYLGVRVPLTLLIEAAFLFGLAALLRA
jgi:hypothetical protein